VLLLRPSGAVIEEFSDGGILYRFRVISLAAMDAEEMMKRGEPCIMPFIPLMRNGENFFDEAERRIYEHAIDRKEKADLLTGMALLSGIISKNLTEKLLQRRLDVMRESFAYELIKQEGYKQGIEEGIEKGMLEDAREMVLEVLSERFGMVPENIESQIMSIKSRRQLKDLHRHAIRVSSIEEFRHLLS
jgi:hypothetical protein